MTKASGLRLLLIFLAPMALTSLVTQFWGISVNATDSLKYKIFLVRKSVLPAKGEYITFKAPEGARYKEPFVKVVGGIHGDVVHRKDRSYYVNAQYIGEAKEFSKTGEPAKLGPVGVIPQGSYFVYTNNKDSYDSRYEEVSWIKSSDVIGVAYPIY